MTLEKQWQKETLSGNKLCNRRETKNNVGNYTKNTKRDFKLRIIPKSRKVQD